MIPPHLFSKIKKRKDDKHREGDDFLHDFKLKRRIDRAAPTVGRHLKTVFKECNRPARNDDQPEGRAFEFQMAIPREGHENVRAGEEHNWQPAGFSQIHEGKMNLRGSRVKWEYVILSRARVCPASRVVADWARISAGND